MKQSSFSSIAGADPNHHSAINGMSCLATASVIGATKVAKLLIDAGASVDLLVHIDIETTSLILACKESRKDIVNLLLQSGADPNLSD